MTLFWVPNKPITAPQQEEEPAEPVVMMGLEEQVSYLRTQMGRLYTRFDGFGDRFENFYDEYRVSGLKVGECRIRLLIFGPNMIGG